MTLYHERFNNLHSDSIDAVDDVAPEIWNVEEHEAMQMLRNLADELAQVYDLPVPHVEFAARNAYNPRSETIVVQNVSLVSFLHEFRHHMQNHGMQANPDIEEDARGWSISLFADAEPEYFESAWEDGRIWFMPDREEVQR